MLIGIDANEANLTRQRVGVNRYAFDLLWAIYQLQSVHEFVIYLKTPCQSDLPPHRLGWNYRIIPFPKFWTQTRLPWDLYTHRPRPDVFFSVTHYAPRFCPIPSVVAVMDLGFLKSPEQFTVRDFNQLKNWTAYSVRHARKIICISRSTRHDVIKYFHKDPRDIHVTYPAYVAERFFPVKDNKIITPTLNKYGIKTPYVIFLSSLKPSKNAEGLIRAFAEFVKHPPFTAYHLVIAGKKAWKYDSVFNLVEELKLGNRVVFTGFVEEEDPPVLMSAAAAYVLPSFYEGFGIPVVEAMACAVPVVVSRVASLPEVAGPAGIYINPNSWESILAGLRTACGPRRSRFVKLGLERVKLFNWNKTADQTLRIIESAV